MQEGDGDPGDTQEAGQCPGAADSPRGPNRRLPVPDPLGDRAPALRLRHRQGRAQHEAKIDPPLKKGLYGRQTLFLSIFYQMLTPEPGELPG